jgi:hypothetical protein
MPDVVKSWSDPETLRTIFTAASTLVSIIALWLTISGRAKTRKETFETDRKTLVADMAANEYLLESFKIQSVLMIDRLHELLAQAPPRLTSNVRESLRHVELFKAQIDQVPTAITSADFRTMKYDRQSINIMKNIRFSVDDMSANLRQPGWQHIFAQAEGAAQQVERYILSKVP